MKKIVHSFPTLFGIGTGVQRIREMFLPRIVYEDVRSSTGRPVVELVGLILGAKPDSFQSPSIAFRFLGLL